MKGTLLWKLLAVNVPVIAATLGVVWLMIDLLAADYFSALMERYHISPLETHEMFLSAVHRYLLQASVVALAFAAGFSFLLTRRVLRPLSDMTEVTRRLAAGDYSARVKAMSNDELGELGSAFNGMADSLERVERLRKAMVADIAHELRTPLTNVRGYLEGLADGVIQPSKQTFAMLQQEILRLVRLVDDLNQLTKAEAAKAYLRREPLSLPDLVEQVLALYRHEFEAREIAVETDFAEGARRIVGDRDKLLQVLRNLVQNAWQYTPRGGRVVLSSAAGENGVTLSLANSGVTLEPADLPHLFERFYRGEKSRSRDSGGAGIGLAIVKELVEAHGGTAGAALETGQTRFWVTLPAGKGESLQNL